VPFKLVAVALLVAQWLLLVASLLRPDAAAGGWIRRLPALVAGTTALGAAMGLTYFYVALGLEGSPLDEVLGVVDTLQSETVPVLTGAVLLAPTVPAVFLARPPRRWGAAVVDVLLVALPVAVYAAMHHAMVCPHDMRGRYVTFLCARTTLATANALVGAAAALALATAASSRRLHRASVIAAVAVAALIALSNARYAP
jgi:hypothetical protein